MMSRIVLVAAILAAGWGVPALAAGKAKPAGKADIGACQAQAQAKYGTKDRAAIAAVRRCMRGEAM